MKNYLLLLLAMMTSLCALAKDYTLEEVRDQWTSREIKVANGGKNPNIVQLLTAFQNVWGTYVVAPVLKCAKDPRFTSMRNEEENEVIIVDRKNGYVCLDNGGTDSGYMEACMFVATTSEVYHYTSYAFLKDSYVWQMITEYPTVVNSDGEPKITVQGWGDMDEEAARKKKHSLGQPIQIKPEWRKVKLSD